MLKCLQCEYGILTMSHKRCQAIVADGISMGHPCCGVFWCTEPLLNNCHWLCATHDHLHSVCHIVDCDEPVVVKEIIMLDGRVIQKRMKTCSLPLHQEMEHLKFAGQGMLYTQRALQGQAEFSPSSSGFSWRKYGSQSRGGYWVFLHQQQSSHPSTHGERSRYSWSSRRHLYFTLPHVFPPESHCKGYGVAISETLTGEGGGPGGAANQFFSNLYI